MTERDALLGPTFGPLRLMEKPDGSVTLEVDTKPSRCYSKLSCTTSRISPHSSYFRSWTHCTVGHVAVNMV